MAETRDNLMFLTVAQVAARLGVHTHTVQHWIATGQLAAVHVGRDASANRRAWRVAPEALEAFLAGRQPAPETNTPAPKGRPKGWRPPSYV